MFPYWPLLVTFFSSLTAAAVLCDAELGTAIRGVDCGWALGILQTRLTLSDARTQTLEHALRPFVRNSLGDPRYVLPQGASFGTCGIGIDVSAASGSVGSWGSLISGVTAIVSRCLGQGLGGINQFGHFEIIVVSAGQGMQNLVGTCMSPTPTYGLPLLWRMKERLCGFPRVAALFRSPDTSQLPASPRSLFANGLALDVISGVPYRVRGQWVWNAETWSPIIGDALTQPAARAIWVLMTGGGPQLFGPTPPPFSRTIPRVMGAAWFQQQNQPPHRLSGAWGARGPTWVPLTGNLVALQALINDFDWLLVELEGSDPATDGGTIPTFGPLQFSAPHPTQVRPAIPPVPLWGQGRPSGAQWRPFSPGSGQGQTFDQGLGLGRSVNPGLGQGRTSNFQSRISSSGLGQGQRFVLGLGQAQIPVVSNQMGTATIDRSQQINSVHRPRQSIGSTWAAASSHGGYESSGSASGPLVPMRNPAALPVFPMSVASVLFSQPQPRTTSEDYGTRPSKRPRPAT